MYLIYYLYALIIGAVTLVFGYRLLKVYRLTYLVHYFYFLLLTQIWGFILWIFPYLAPAIQEIGPHPSQPLQSVFIVSKWFGFPIQILHAYFLLTTAWGMLAKTVKKNFIISYFLISFLLLGGVLASLFWGVKMRQWHPFTLVTFTTTYLFLVFELGVVLIGSLKARRIPDASGQKGIFLFFLLYGIGFLIYILGGILFSLGRLFYVGVYYALHLPPLLILNHFLAHSSRRIIFDDIRPEILSDFLSGHRLTKREREIVTMLLKGKSNRDIEKELYISIQTVKNHITSIYKKLNVKNRIALINMIQNHLSSRTQIRG